MSVSQHGLTVDHDMRNVNTLRSELASEVLRCVRTGSAKRLFERERPVRCSPSPRSANFPGARAANLALPAGCWMVIQHFNPRTNGDGHTLDGGGRASEAEESASGFEHEGDHLLTEVERAVKVDVYARLDVLAREFEEGLHDEGRVGIKQGRSELVRWPRLLDGGEGVLNRLGVGHIACERVGLQQEVPVADGRRFDSRWGRTKKRDDGGVSTQCLIYRLVEIVRHSHLHHFCGHRRRPLRPS